MMTDTAPLTGKQRERRIFRVTALGAVGNFLLVTFKFIAGIVGHSSAMIADAIHSTSDFFTDMVVMVMVRISSKPSDETHEYGHGKFETLATLIISVTLFVAGAVVLWDGAVDIWDYCRGARLERPGMIAFWAAIVSIVLKEGLYRYTIREARIVNSKAVEANAWDHRSDAFSSIGTAVGIGGAALLGPGWTVLDPIAAVLVSVFILRAGWELMRPCIDELLERSLPREQEQMVLDAIAEEPEALHPHNLRTRRIGNYAAVEVHVRMNPGLTVGHSHEVTRRIEEGVKRRLGPDTYVTIHVEPLK